MPPRFAAFAGEISTARRHFESLISQLRPYQWQQGLYYRALDLANALHTRRQFVDSVFGIVHRRRTQLLLDHRETEKLGLPNDVTQPSAAAPMRAAVREQADRS
jgi:hypothetical protein